MIPQDEINYIKQEADLLKVVESMGVEMRRAGANWVGRCPFHNENTGSFTVFPRSNHWKCFGCGDSGNAVDFVMKKKGCDFVEAVKYVADIMGMTLTDDYQESPEQKIVRERKMQQVEVNKLAVVWFQQQLAKHKEVQAYVESRGWNQETVEQWEIGYAPDDWNALWNYLQKEKHVSYDTLTKSTLFAQSKKTGGYYCRFRGRLMFPIFNTSGEPVAFSGRILEAKEGEAKYINSSGDADDPNTLYIKGEILFGWNFARAEARNSGEAVLVEGNPDTIKMHQLGVTNVTAACGTALTKEAAELLAKTVRRATLLYDSDDAGQKATERNGKVLIEAGVMVYVLTLPPKTDKDGHVLLDKKGRPEKQDPDTFFESADHFREFSKTRKSWFEFVATRRKAEMSDKPDPTEVSGVANELAPLLLKRDEGERMAYVDQLAKMLPPKKLWTAALKQTSEEQVRRLNEQGYTEEQQEMIDKYGFCMSHNCYHIQTSIDGGWREVSNFILEPLFHIESTVNAKRLYRLRNNRGIVKVLEIPQKDLVSLAAFKTRVESFGNFLFTGTDSDLNKIKAYLYEATKSCREVERLGWQKEGFWAWSNGAVLDNGAMLPIDDLGTVEVGKQWYYLPALSSYYVSDEGLFNYERNFIHTPSGADLMTLALKMQRCYGDNAVVGLGFYMATLFRDIVFAKFGAFPILNIFGQKGTGKSTMALTLMRLFSQSNKPGDLLTNSTAPGLAMNLSRCKNALAHIDEYKNNEDYLKIELLKGVYNSSGRSRINIDRDKKTEVTPIDCGLILTGQEIPNADPALFGRLIYLTVSKTNFSDEERSALADLKAYEKRGLTDITNEILRQREWVSAHYETCVEQVDAELKQLLKSRSTDMTRIRENWWMVLAMVKCLDGRVNLPWSYAEAVQVFVQGIENQQASNKETDELGEFWHGVESMLTNGEIETEYDLTIQYGKSDFKLDYGFGKDRLKREYSQTYDVLFMNPDRLFDVYAQHVKKVKDNKAGLLGKASLRHYLLTSQEYMGESVRKFKVPTRLRQNPGAGQSIDDQTGDMKVLLKSSRALAFNYARLKEQYGIDLDVVSEVMEGTAKKPDVEIPY